MVFKKVELFNNLSFSEKSAQTLCIGKRGVTGHFSDNFTSSLNLRHSCTSPVLCWSLGSISTAIAWEKKALGCHKFCLSKASIGWLSTGLNHTFLAKSALKQYCHRKKMSQCTLCEKWKHSYQNCLRYGRKSAETVTSYWSPLKAGPPPWLEFLVIFDFFAPWYRRAGGASSVKIW